MVPTDTRERILQAAGRLFLRQGYTATSVSRISKEARIGKATVYHHFKDKHAIIQALLDRTISRIQNAISTADGDTDPRRRIEATAKASLGFLKESMDLFQVIRREVPESRGRLQSEFAAFIRSYTASLTDAIREGIRQGIFRQVNPSDAARALLAMLTGLYAQFFAEGNRETVSEKTLASILDVFFQGIESH
jgi:AcrR family transcriptional regulator